jgi:PBSX family phage portal protein
MSEPTQQTPLASVVQSTGRRVRTFSFGEPESVLAGHMGEYLGVFASDDGQIYTPPVSRTGLAKLLRANAHHGTIPRFKRNLLLRDFIPSAGCSAQTMGRAALDFMVFGEGYFLRKRNVLGQLLELEHLPALNMRRKVGGGFVMLLPDGKQLHFEEDEVEHVMDYDVEQNIYGVPDYLGGMHALLLNESATLFRRRYFNNGAHAGFVFYTNDPNLSEEDEKALQAKIAGSKGVGNFRSLFVNIPGGSDKAIQIIPMGDIATKDEFERIKNITRNDVIAAWRMNPALAGVMPENAAGFGDVEKIDRVYTNNEIRPIRQLFLQINERLRSERRINWAT